MSDRRSTAEIKADLGRHRRELEDDLNELAPRRAEGTSKAGIAGLSGDVPVWAFAAGSLVGFLFMRRPLWPLRMAGRLVGIAAPIAIPLIVKRLGRSP